MRRGCRRFLYSLLILSLLAAAGCEKAPSPPQETPEPIEVAPLKSPEASEAFLTFVSGDVLLADRGGEWRAADIGAAVSESRRLKVGADSFCEIQFGRTAVVRVQQNTEVLMEVLYLKAQSVKIGLKVQVGGVLSKVSRMSTGQEFTVRTTSVAVGVRGTVFLVREERERDPVVAVREGKVAVTSAGLDIAALRGSVSGKDPRLAREVGRLEDAVVVVEADQEVTLSRESLGRTAEEYRTVQETVDRVLAAMEEAETEQVPEPELTDLKREVAAVVKTVVEEYEPPQPISEDNGAALDEMRRARLLELEEEKMARVSLSTEPRDADILLDGRLVGRGRASGLFAPGAKLRVLVRREGYTEKQLEIDVQKGRGDYRVVLEKTPREEDAAADSTATDDGAAPAERTVRTETVRVVVEPADAEIAVDDRFAGRGTLERELEIGRSVVITAAREGYHDAVLELDVVEGAGGTYRLVLEPNPILMRLPVTDAPITGSLVTDPRRIVGIDRSGTIIIYDRFTNAIKSIPTEQHTVNSTPVLAGDRLYFIGEDQFLTADVRAAKLLHAVRLDEPSALAGGRKPLPFHERGLYTDAGRLVVFDRVGGEPVDEIPVPDGAVMSPVAFRDIALIINSGGMLLAVDERNRLEPFMPEPILPSPAILAVENSGRLAALGGDGALVCVDLERRRVIWESRMPLDADPDVPLAMELSPDVLYVMNRELLFGWLAGTGESLFPAVEGVSSPPIYLDGLLAYGTLDGRLVVADGFTAEPVRVLELGERITVRPWLEGGNLLVGTEVGSIFLINPEAIR